MPIVVREDGRKDFWKSNWFLGVIAALAVASLSQADLVKSLEREACDRGVLASSRNPNERVAIDAPTILDQVLAKTNQERYRTGEQMAHAMRERTASISIVDAAL
jgi:CHASE2 domain-containing sensor protein